jgi:hypothetical protein
LPAAKPSDPEKECAAPNGDRQQSFNMLGIFNENVDQ